MRPFVFANTAGIQASPSKRIPFYDHLLPCKGLLFGAMRVKVEEKFSRAAPGGVGYAKAAGNYAAQFYPTGLAQKEDYQQVILDRCFGPPKFRRIGNHECVCAPK